MKSTLRVLIDLTQIPIGRMGAGSYGENLLEHLRDHSAGIELFVVLQSDDPALRIAVPLQARIFSVPAGLFRKLPLRLLLEQVYLPFLAIKYRIDVIHSLHYSFSLLSGGAKRVVTLHDMTSFLLPEMHPPLKRNYVRFFTTAAVHRAEHLIFISHSALSDAEKHFRRVLPKATVIHHGTSAHFSPDLDPAKIAAAKKQYDVPEEYILYLGTIEPRKNINYLLRAFARLAAQEPEARLVIAGKKGWYYHNSFELVRELELEPKVIFTGYIDEMDKPYLLAGAKLFVYPSLYEGFGLPVLESMACGVPTISSNISSIPEVAGEGAILIDPSSVDELAIALRRLYTDAKLRSALRSKGLEQAAKFSWEKSVAELVRVYTDVGRAPGSSRPGISTLRGSFQSAKESPGRR